MSKLDLTNARFGRLTVIKESHKTDRIVWECLCDCGKTSIVAGSDLRAGKTKSCGCYKIDCIKRQGHRNRGSLGQAGCSAIYGSYKYRVVNKGLKFDFTKKEFKLLCEQPCFYCGQEPGNLVKGPYSSNGDWWYSGLDRIDSSKGYTKDNCVPCCKRCNIAKNNQTTKEFFNQVKSIYELHEMWKG